MAINSVPDGFHTITPYLRIKNASAAIEYYKQAFGAAEISRMPGPGGAIMHAELQIGDSKLMLSDEFPQWGCVGPETLKGTSVTIHLYVPDVDATMKQAATAGGKISHPPTDMFWGDRNGRIEDPFGHSWSIATHKEDLTPAEVEQRGKAFMTQMCEKK